MNYQKQQMVCLLTDLKKKYYVQAVKAEFESEGSSFEEICVLKNIVTQAGLDLCIKIGGCAAINDLNQVKKIMPKSIVAPMIETPYAMQKFISSAQSVFTKEELSDIKLFINIETITGFNNLENIIKSPYFVKVAGVVFGRSDFVASIGLSKEKINDNTVLNNANLICKEMKKLDKKMIVGGGISLQSLPFLKEISFLTEFETRKIVFNATPALSDNNAEIGILKALEFEILWLEYKQEFFGELCKEDKNRLLALKNTISEANITNDK